MYCTKCGTNLGDSTVCPSCASNSEEQNQIPADNLEPTNPEEKQKAVPEAKQEEMPASESLVNEEKVPEQGAAGDQEVKTEVEPVTPEEVKSEEVSKDTEEIKSQVKSAKTEETKPEEEQAVEEVKQEAESTADEKTKSATELAKAEEESGKAEKESVATEEIKPEEESAKAEEAKQETELSQIGETKQEAESVKAEKVKTETEPAKAEETKSKINSAANQENNQIESPKQTESPGNQGVTLGVKTEENPQVTQEVRQEITDQPQKVKSAKKFLPLAIVLIIVFLIAIVAYMKGAPEREIRSYLLKDQIRVGGKTYQIDKKVLREVKNVKKQKYSSLLISGTQISGDITLITEDFKAEGTVVVYKVGKDIFDISYDLQYKPLKMVDEESIRSDILLKSVEIKDIGYIDLSGRNVTKMEIQEVKGDLDESKCSAVLAVELTQDIFKAIGNIELDYKYEYGKWYLVGITPKGFQCSYLEGKDLSFSLEEFVDYYNRGRYYTEIAEGKRLSAALDKESLSLDKTEQNGMYSKKVILNLNRSKPFYDVTGKVEVHYTCREEQWEVDRVVIDADYNFKLVGEYEGWYWAGLLAPVQRDGKLEITKVNNKTGEFDAIFHFTTPDNPDAKGSYYVGGKVQPAAIKGDEISWQGEKWIKQPSGFYMVNFYGMLNEDEQKIEGTTDYTSNKFEFTKVE